ncbi:MAG: hypothetical protein ACOCVT_00580, partial [bacterium]
MVGAFSFSLIKRSRPGAHDINKGLFVDFFDKKRGGLKARPIKDVQNIGSGLQPSIQSRPETQGLK